MKKKTLRKLSLNFDLFYQMGALIVGILLSIALARNILIISKANKRIEKIKSEIVEITKKNEELKKQIQIADTEEFTEREARNKLGLVKEGEVVVVLPPPDVIRKFAPKTYEEEDTLPDPNWKKWMELFF